MTTNNDILLFLKTDMDKRAKEKEEEKVLRATERKEDMEQIVTLMQKSIQREVDAAIKPLEERLEVQEYVNKELFSQVKLLKQELNLKR